MHTALIEQADFAVVGRGAVVHTQHQRPAADAGVGAAVRHQARRHTAHIGLAGNAQQGLKPAGVQHFGIVVADQHVGTAGLGHASVQGRGVAVCVVRQGHQANRQRQFHAGQRVFQFIQVLLLAHQQHFGQGRFRVALQRIQQAAQVAGLYARRHHQADAGRVGSGVFHQPGAQALQGAHIFCQPLGLQLAAAGVEFQRLGWLRQDAGAMHQHGVDMA